MAQSVRAEGCGRTDFCGLESLFEFTNDDGQLKRTNCGQAAAATFLTHHGKLDPVKNLACDLMAILEKEYPPDQFFGWFGTGPRQVQRICQVYGFPLEEIRGEEDLKECLRHKRPVIVMLGVSAGRMLNINLPGGHWMVAYAFNNDNIYLTNHGAMSWEEFRQGWYAMVPRLIAMQGRGLTSPENAVNS